MKSIKNFDEKMERAEQIGNEWVFGAIETDLGAIPATIRLNWLPDGVLQYTAAFDTFGCASRAPIYIWKAKFTYFYHNGMHPVLKEWLRGPHYIGGKPYSYIVGEGDDAKVVFDETFTEILSGTTPTGNSLKAPVQTTHEYGLIPECLPLDQNMAWQDYMAPERITQEMKDLGQELLKRFGLNYEKVVLSRFEEAIAEDLLDVAGHAWVGPFDGVYPKTDDNFNHAFARIDNEINAGDSYEPFLKRLAKDFRFFDWGYSFSITSQNPFVEKKVGRLTLWEFVFRFFKSLRGKLGAAKPRVMTLKIVASGYEQEYVWKVAEDIKDFFAPVVTFDIVVEQKNLVPKYDSSILGAAPLAICDYEWYDTNVSVPNLTYDIVMLLIRRPNTPDTPAGVMTFANCGPWETTVFGADATATTGMIGRESENRNAHYAKHEISHSLYWMKGIADRTHEHLYSGHPERVLQDLSFGEMTTGELLRELVRKLNGALVALRIIAKNRQTIVDSESRKDYLTPMAEAIKAFEDFVQPGGKYRDGTIAQNGSVSWRCKNPGNLKLGLYTKNFPGRIGTDGSNHIIFDTYENGWNALIGFLRNACEGKYPKYSPNGSIKQFFGTYQEASSAAYSAFVCNYMSEALGEPIYPSRKLRELV